VSIKPALYLKSVLGFNGMLIQRLRGQNFHCNATLSSNNLDHVETEDNHK